MMNRLSKLLGALSAILLLSAVVLALSLRNADPISTGSIAAADAQTEGFMEALCSGEYDTAAGYLRGSPALAPQDAFSNALTEALWSAYTDTTDYTFHGSCYADDYGLYRDVTVTRLDIPAVIADLQSRSSVSLSKSDREDLAEIAAELIAKGTYTTEYTITLQLTGFGGQWQIEPTPQLIALMQGTVGGA